MAWSSIFHFSTNTHPQLGREGGQLPNSDIITNTQTLHFDSPTKQIFSKLLLKFKLYYSLLFEHNQHRVDCVGYEHLDSLGS